MIGGRRWWLAWPAGILCAGVVAGLVYLALPAMPGVAVYARDTLRDGAQTRAEPVLSGKPLAEIGTALTDDCVSLYPSSLWLKMTFDPHTVLSQNMAAPSAELMRVMDAWHPAPRMTCGWRDFAGGTVRTSLVDLEIPAAVQSAGGGSGNAAQQAIAKSFAARGYGCRLSGADAVRLTCTRTRGGTDAIEVIEGATWLSNAETAWHPHGYVPALVHRLWPRAAR